MRNIGDWYERRRVNWAAMAVLACRIFFLTAVLSTMFIIELGKLLVELPLHVAAQMLNFVGASKIARCLDGFRL